jgi:hypothetical protein
VSAENSPVVIAVPTLPDMVTVLRAKGTKFLTKRWTRVGGQLEEISYDKVRLFSASEYPVSNTHDLGELIRQISNDPQAAIVRGAPAPGVDRNNMLRRARPREGIPATLIATPRWWLGLDLDDIPCPPETDPLFEPDAIVEHTISLLPTAFHETTCLWQFTAGHGFKPGIRLRLWYWLARPASDEELRQWLGERVPQDSVPRHQWRRRWPIDPVLFNPIQLHYTAAPIFEDLPDPVLLRCGWHRGLEDAVVVPDQLPAKECVGRVSISNQRVEPGLGYEGFRARIGDHEGGDGFFRPIKSAIGAYFAVNGAHTDAEWLINDLTTVIQERRGNRLDAYIEGRVRDLLDAVGAIQSMQAAREREEAERAKQIVRFEGESFDPLLLAGSLEDAEAGWKATGYEAWACLAGMPNTLIDIAPIGRIVVVLHADVGRFSPTRRVMRNTIRHWRRQGYTVLEAIPRGISKGDGLSFADLQKGRGLETVKERIEAALTPRSPPSRMPVDDARQTLGDAIKTAFEELSSWKSSSV